MAIIGAYDLGFDCCEEEGNQLLIGMQGNKCELYMEGDWEVNTIYLDREKALKLANDLVEFYTK